MKRFDHVLKLPAKEIKPHHVDVLSAKAGSLGVIYERYSLGGEEPTGVGIILSNGEYDGFSRSDLKLCKVTHTGRIDNKVSAWG